ncbi:MAG TPA: c-type cytochrome [Blastocatellia bacterium]|nr:c-type cytochrome [Blastocatellia bacterium]
MKNSSIVKLSILSAALTTLSFALLNSSTAAFNSSALPITATATNADASALFAAKCAICHGKDGRGQPNWRAKGQPDFTDAGFQKSRTDAQIADTIRNGKGRYMPAWKSKLSDEEIKALVRRVRAFGKK